MINYYLKGLYKTICYKTKSNFSQFFFFQWLLYECFFLFPYQRVSKFENLKILLEIFCQKVIVSKAILTFLEHLKLKLFYACQPWWPIYSAPSFQNLWIRPWFRGLFGDISRNVRKHSTECFMAFLPPFPAFSTFCSPFLGSWFYT